MAILQNDEQKSEIKKRWCYERLTYLWKVQVWLKTPCSNCDCHQIRKPDDNLYIPNTCFPDQENFCENQAKNFHIDKILFCNMQKWTDRGIRMILQDFEMHNTMFQNLVPLSICVCVFINLYLRIDNNM